MGVPMQAMDTPTPYAWMEAEADAPRLPEYRLEGCATAFYVGYRDPLDQGRSIGRSLMRFLYWLCGYPTTAYFHSQGIATDIGEAKRMANTKGMFYQELPVNEVLPLEKVRFGRDAHPLSPVPAFRETPRKPHMVAVDERDLRQVCELVAETQRLCGELKKT
jgi:hypothetical protein